MLWLIVPFVPFLVILPLIDPFIPVDIPFDVILLLIDPFILVDIVPFDVILLFIELFIVPFDIFEFIGIVRLRFAPTAILSAFPFYIPKLKVPFNIPISPFIVIFKVMVPFKMPLTTVPLVKVPFIIVVNVGTKGIV